MRNQWRYTCWLILSSILSIILIEYYLYLLPLLKSAWTNYWIIYATNLETKSQTSSSFSSNDICKIMWQACIKHDDFCSVITPSEPAWHLLFRDYIFRQITLFELCAFYPCNTILFLFKSFVFLVYFNFFQFFNFLDSIPFFFTIFKFYNKSWPLNFNLFRLWCLITTIAILTIWARGVGPRFRPDQLSDLTWKDLLLFLAALLILVLVFAYVS